MNPKQPRSSSLTTSAALVCLLLMLSPVSFAAGLEHKTVCTWDPVGKTGPVMAFFADLIPEAINWGLDLKFISYQDENLAASDLADGKCDVAIVTAILSRDFVQFAGTLDAIGGLTSERKLRKAMASIASPKATELMSMDGYEVVASLPVGSMFAFVNDRSIDTIDDFRNKKIAVLNNDIQTTTFAELASATPIPETLSTFAHSFNEGRVDIVLMPALAYNTFELYRGLGDKGGIMDVRMFYGMLQAVARKSEFSDDFGRNMRRYMVSRLSDVLALIDEAEASIPPRYWIHTSEATKETLEEFYKDIRLTLKVEQRFDPKALTLLWKIRCSVSPKEDECQRP